MRKSRALSILALSTTALAVRMIAAKSRRADSVAPLKTVPSLDLNRYSGTWYEIARYPNRFQRKCAGDTTANYSLRRDGKIAVVNSCRKQDGTVIVSRGTAKVVDNTSSAKLKVTFFWPFSGDYWIIGLASDYSYAIVGEPSRKYVWILSRTPQMPDALYDRAMRTIRDSGYDPSRLLNTRHSGKAQPAAS